jgi:hypothetical protein
MGYSDGAMERAMKRQEVILKALSGEIHWFRAAEILGMSMRTLRRYRAGLQKWGYEGLFDHRRRSPSPGSVPVAEVKRILGLYRERYRGWNVRHFFETACRGHGVKVSYTFVKQALQGAGLVDSPWFAGPGALRRYSPACVNCRSCGKPQTAAVSHKDLGRRRTDPAPTVTTGPSGEVLTGPKGRQKRTDHLSTTPPVRVAWKTLDVSAPQDPSWRPRTQQCQGRS